MASIPFITPTLAQVTTVQYALMPLEWGIRRTPAWREGLWTAREAFANGPPVPQSTLAARTGGEISYLFRYESDPEGFERMIVKPRSAIGPSFMLRHRDDKEWRKTNPLVIAVHERGECQTVSTRLYLQATALIPVASREGEFMVVEDLYAGSESLRLISHLLWAGLGVHLPGA